jgi:pimeloyl-ACP methyl ester carboxylesterase
VLIDVMDAAGVQRADVVAHSWGSSVTLALALAHPERVRRITLIGAWIYDEQIPPFFRWARVPGVGEALFSAFYTERPADRFPDAFDDPSLVSQELVEAIEQSLSRPGTSRAALAAARGQCFLQMERRYRTIAHRTLLVWGEDDHVARLRFGQRLSQEMPDARTRRACHRPLRPAPQPPPPLPPRRPREGPRPHPPKRRGVPHPPGPRPTSWGRGVVGSTTTEDARNRSSWPSTCPPSARARRTPLPHDVGRG